MSAIQLQMATPCQQQWHKMLPEQKGRFCLQCQKTVVDFTRMSDGQLLAYFEQYKGQDTCGRFTDDQLERTIRQPRTSMIGRWKYFWQVLLPAVFAVQKGVAQTVLHGKPVPVAVCRPDTVKSLAVRPGAVAVSPAQKPVYTLRGRVVDETGAPLAGVSVLYRPYQGVATNNPDFFGPSSKLYKGVATDSLGYFALSLAVTDSFELSVSYVGFQSKAVLVEKCCKKELQQFLEKGNYTKEIRIELAAAERLVLGAVMVVSSKKPTRRQLSKALAATLVSKQPAGKKTDAATLYIYPNPVTAGRDFQVQLDGAKRGIYQLSVTDGSGKLVGEKRWLLKADRETIAVEGALVPVPGIYFIHVQDLQTRNGKPLSGKILVQ